MLSETIVKTHPTHLIYNDIKPVIAGKYTALKPILLICLKLIMTNRLAY